MIFNLGAFHVESYLTPVFHDFHLALGRERAGLYASRAVEYIFFACVTFCPFFSFWYRELAAACDCGTPWTFHLNQLMRLWHLSPSVNSIFKHACAAVHWSYTSDCLVRPFVYFHTSCVRTAKALARLRGSQARLSLRWSPVR